MFNILLVARNSLLSQPGGDTYQILETKERLIQAGFCVELYLQKNKAIDVSSFDVLHFFNIGRPADFLNLAKMTKKPYVVTPIFVDYSDTELSSGGWRSRLTKVFGIATVEYLKTVMRTLNGTDKLRSIRFLYTGWTNSIKYILKHASAVMPHTFHEKERLEVKFGTWKGNTTVNFVGLEFIVPEIIEKEPNLVVCAARIDRTKNQLGLIHALKDTNYKLVLIGGVAANQKDYFEECKNEGGNVVFTGHLNRKEVARWMAKAKVHAMPSFFETTGLSTAESLLCGCNAIVAAIGDEEECFGDMVYYCNPSNIESIKDAVEKAMNTPFKVDIPEVIRQRFSWDNHIKKLIEVYHGIGNKKL